ncbi:MAG TPA: hypothetical protein PLU43_00515 [Lachnospiraceae bacterium]|nr:hypothetical protein [Lachnospiraceae bacterium]
MVFVDIRIPQLAKTYDFRLDEKTETAVLIRQTSVILFGKEVQGALFDLTQKQILCGNRTLTGQGTVSGHTLLLLFI